MIYRYIERSVNVESYTGYIDIPESYTGKFTIIVRERNTTG